jgi:moderate conductance mechanosensitive channel
MNAIFAIETSGTAQGGLWHKFIDHIWDLLKDTQMWTTASTVLLRIILIFVISRLVLIAINRFIDHVTNEKKSRRLKLRARRVQTVGKLMKNTASYTLNFIAILLILGEFHIQLAPLLAGAGVLGLAIGFGAQSLVKDVITGFFIILEDQFAVGDVVQTGAFKGTVEMIGLRATRLKSATGEIHVIPNGTINEVTNFSINPSTAIVDLTIPYEDSLEDTMGVIRSSLMQIEDANLIGTPTLLGVQAISFNQMTLRITAQCKANTNAEVTRLINTEVKREIDIQRRLRTST